MYINRIAELNLQNLLKSNKIIIILGARQVGKTTLIKHLLEPKKTVFLNFDIESDKQRLKAASSLPPKEAMRNFGDPDYLVIDEAQRLPEIGSIAKGWFDSGVPVKIVLLGSSSLDLVNKSAESLTGRNEKIILPPLLFRETISNKEWYSQIYSDSQIEENFSSQVRESLLQSLVFGNYPEVISHPDKIGYLLNLASDYLFKDIMQLGLIKTPELIRRLLALLAHQVGSEFSLNELANNLGIARATVERYLELLEQTFVIFRLPAWSTNPRKEITKSHKAYFWDTGIRNAVLNEFSLSPLRPDIGALWENWAVSEFAKLNLISGQRKNLYFWRSRSGTEVDLIIKEGEKITAYEMKWNDKKIISRVFLERYGVKVKLITSSHPLFSL